MSSEVHNSDKYLYSQAVVCIVLFVIYLTYVIVWRNKNMPQRKWYDLGPFNLFFYSLPLLGLLITLVSLLPPLADNAEKNKQKGLTKELTLRNSYLVGKSSDQVLLVWLRHVDYLRNKNGGIDLELKSNVGSEESDEDDLPQGILQKLKPLENREDTLRFIAVASIFSPDDIQLHEFLPRSPIHINSAISALADLSVSDLEAYADDDSTLERKAILWIKYLKNDMPEYLHRQLIDLAISHENAELANLAYSFSFGSSDYNFESNRLVSLSSRQNDYFLLARVIFNSLQRNFVGSALVFSLLLALLWVIYLIRLSPISRKGIRFMLLGFGCGLLSTLPSIYIESYIANNIDGSYLSIFTGVGLVEEFCKDLFIIGAYLLMPRMRSIHILRFAIMVALGFACMENSLYIRDYNFSLITVRCMFATISHIFYASLPVYIIARYRGENNMTKMVFRLVGIFIIAAAIHGLYDYMLLSGQPFVMLLALPLVWLPGIYMLARIINSVLNMTAAEVPHDDPYLPQKLASFLLAGFLTMYVLDYVYATVFSVQDKALVSFMSALPIFSLLMFFTSFRLSSIIVLPGVQLSLIGSRGNTYQLYFKQLLDHEFQLAIPFKSSAYSCTHLAIVENVHRYKGYSDYIEVVIKNSSISHLVITSDPDAYSKAIIQTDRFGEIPGTEQEYSGAKLWVIPEIAAGIFTLEQILSATPLPVELLPIAQNQQQNLQSWHNS